jgi:hypothetical protein
VCININSYKFGDRWDRFLTINHTDPGGRDRNGYMTGSYYVGVFGYCYEEKYQKSADDLPCANYDITFNVTVKLIPCID